MTLGTHRNACLGTERLAFPLAKGVGKGLARAWPEIPRVGVPPLSVHALWLPAPCTSDILPEGFLWPWELRSARDSVPLGAALTHRGGRNSPLLPQPLAGKLHSVSPGPAGSLLIPTPALSCPASPLRALTMESWHHLLNARLAPHSSSHVCS